MDFLPRRKLNHVRPSWVDDSDPIFLTICCQNRKVNQLAEPRKWSCLLKSAEEMRDNNLWNPRLIVAMPDHVHLIADIPRSLTDAATALPVQIYLWSDLPELTYQSKTAGAIIVLVAVLFALNGIAIYLRKRFERRW